MTSRRIALVVGLFLTLAILGVSTGCGTNALAYLMGYQGRLTDQFGNPLGGNRDMTFRLFTGSSGGSAVWSETQAAVPVSNGLFSVALGAGTPIDESIMHQPLWLEVQVGAETMTPRTALVGSPYAFSLVPGAVVKGYINSTETYSSTLNVGNYGSGQAIAGQSLTGAAIVGMSASSGDGVHGLSNTGDGVHGEANSAAKSGVDGYSVTGFGVTGRSNNRPGVQGFSTLSHGMYAEGATYGFFTPDKVFAGSGYVDIAEHMDAAEDVEPGDVVCIDVEHDRRVVKSAQPYDTMVAGIISTDPAMLIGDSESPSPLALAGQVPCKVSAEGGPIRRGDLLVTSSTPGHAMKATDPRPGTVLGKALGELETGTGVIYVLVTLQ